MACVLVCVGCGPEVANGGASSSGADGDATSHDGDSQSESTGDSIDGCWEWRPGVSSMINANVALADGGVIAAGMAQGQLLLARLDVDGDVVWTAEPNGRGVYWGIAALPSGAFVVMGTSAVSPLERGTPVLRAYADDGTQLWDSVDVPSRIERLSPGVWWTGGERLLAVAVEDPAIPGRLLTFDETGVRRDEIDVTSYGELNGVTSLGDGFAFCGRDWDGENGTAVIEAHDAAGAPMWTYDSGEIYAWECIVASDRSDRVVAVLYTSDNTGQTAVRIISLVDGEPQWERSLAGARGDRGIAMGPDGATYFSGPELSSAWLRGLSADGMDILAVERSVAGENATMALSVGVDRVYRSGYDGPLIMPDGYLGCVELAE